MVKGSDVECRFTRPSCRSETETFWSFSKCPKCGRKYSVEQIQMFNSLTEEEQDKVIALYEALYVDGYRDLLPTAAMIFLLEKEMFILIGEMWNQSRIKVGYESIQLLNILQEREVTALRTFLIGPVRRISEFG
jgi:hypothetical protein